MSNAVFLPLVSSLVFACLGRRLVSAIGFNFCDIVDKGIHTPEHLKARHLPLHHDPGEWIQRIPAQSTHSRKPDETYNIIEACSTGPYLELFARGTRKGWTAWGNQADAYEPTWKTYANHSASERQKKKAATLFDV
jgi:hypothetical protein